MRRAVTRARQSRPVKLALDPLGLKRALVLRQISWQEAATAAGVSYTFLCHVLAGRRRSAHVETALKDLIDVTDKVARRAVG